MNKVMLQDEVLVSKASHPPVLSGAAADPDPAGGDAFSFSQRPAGTAQGGKEQVGPPQHAEC